MKAMLTTMLGATVLHVPTGAKGKVRAIAWDPELGDFRFLVSREADDHLLSWSYENCNLVHARRRRAQ